MPTTVKVDIESDDLDEAAEQKIATLQAGSWERFFTDNGIEGTVEVYGANGLIARKHVPKPYTP